MCGRLAFAARLSFELLGRSIAQGGMQALLVVVPLNELGVNPFIETVFYCYTGSWFDSEPFT
jgi:hypothetical protein